MSTLLVGKVDYLNCFPIYYPLEQGIITLAAEIVKGPPAVLNNRYSQGKLDINPISSIEYARNPQISLVLPNLSISADGKVDSILLFSKVPVERLHQKNVALTSSSATSVVLLKILLEIFFQVIPNYRTMHPDLTKMLDENEAALLIGDDALNEAMANKGHYIYDLGELWYRFTGLPMVYALWVIRKEAVQTYPDLAQTIIMGFNAAKEWQAVNAGLLLEKAGEKYLYSTEVINNYFSTIRYDLTGPFKEGLARFYGYARELGIIDRAVDLELWG